MVGRIACSEKTGEDQNALGMNGAAQLDFALNIDHFPLAEPNASRDAAGMAERVVCQLHNREAVDLADPFATSIHKDRPLLNLLQEPLLQSAGTMNQRINRPLDILGSDSLSSGEARPIVRFPEQIR